MNPHFSHSSPRPRSKKEAGLTLLELLVVLGILAVLSTVALRNVTNVIEERTYDANISQLEELQNAILGSQDDSGFLGDIGRLPIARGTVAEEQLQELLDGTAASFLSYTINTPTGDNEIRLGTGWRGPYLNLGINRSDLTDAFTNPFVLFQADGSAADDGDTAAIIQSLGAEGISGGTSFNEDFEVVFEAGAGAVTAGLVDAEANNWQSNVAVIVLREGNPISIADGTFLVVRAYGADGSGGLHTVEEENAILSADIPSQSFTLAAIPHGSKVFRAYQANSSPADKDLPIPAPTLRSPATHVVVGRTTPTITLVLY